VTWRCTWCGREYDENDPPCETCGRESFEHVEDDSSSAFQAESFVWVCENCGREHVKNAKICTGCSHPSLEKRAVGDEDLSEELSTPGYLDVGWPYLLVAGVVVVLVALAIAGVIPVPGAGGPPAPPAAPGEATEAAGLDLRTVETEVRGAFDEERGAERGRDDGLDALATYAVRHDVATRYDPDYDREFPGAGAFDPNCGSDLVGDVVELPLDPASFDDEAALAEAIAADLLDDADFEQFVTGEATAEAVAVHVTPDDTVAVGYAAC
jgi:hypothetical protein